MPPRGKGTYGKKVGRPPKPPKGPKKPKGAKGTSSLPFSVQGALEGANPTSKAWGFLGGRSSGRRKGAKSVLKGRLKWSGSKLPTPKGPKGPKRKKISSLPFSVQGALKGALKSPTMESRVKREKIYRGMNLIFKQMGLKTRGKLKTRRK